MVERFVEVIGAFPRRPIRRRGSETPDLVVGDRRRNELVKVRSRQASLSEAVDLDLAVERE
jgi:hypothetical protein